MSVQRFTVVDFAQRASELRQQWDGTGSTEPPYGVCPICGAIVEGSAENIERHLTWHRVNDHTFRVTA